MNAKRNVRSLRLGFAVVAAGLLMPPWPAVSDSMEDGEEWPSGDEIARMVNARDDGESVAQTLVMELIDRRGSTRTRETRSFRKDIGPERRSVIFFREPKNLKDTAFLTFDYPEPARDDDQWLYLSALRKVRRISGADRGGSFLGTDFSYEDIKQGTRVSIHDYNWKTLGEEVLDGRHCYIVEAVPVDEKTARELRYGRLKAWVDSEIWIVRQSEVWDVRQKPLKQVKIGEIRQVEGIWTPHRLEAVNHKTSHRTVFTIRDVSYAEEVSDDLFTERALRRGL